ncbi:MAG: hypothetical protein ACD_39C00836G0001 [uncultured bacterium]|nr:MAG: hypothetical protein ACD_39C00836G0001 [uncultured bacterium]
MAEKDKPDNQTKSDETENDVYKRLNAFRPPECKLKKHPCKDCFNCLFCGDARCEICLRSKCCHDTKKAENDDK